MCLRILNVKMILNISNDYYFCEGVSNDILNSINRKGIVSSLAANNLVHYLSRLCSNGINPGPSTTKLCNFLEDRELTEPLSEIDVITIYGQLSYYIKNH